MYVCTRAYLDQQTMGEMIRNRSCRYDPIHTVEYDKLVGASYCLLHGCDTTKINMSRLRKIGVYEVSRARYLVIGT